MNAGGLGALLFVAVGCAGSSAGREPEPRSEIASALVRHRAIDLEGWSIVETIEIDRPVYHPQGLTELGGHFYLSSVEITECTREIEPPIPAGSPDRTAGRGRGHLFKIDRRGRVVDRVELGDGDAYHPGGIDQDGAAIWVPVAEYRPRSRSVIYAIDPRSMEAREMFRVEDHIGGIAFDPAREVVHGISWGSRTIYSWTEGGRELTRSPNGSHHVDYQDCQFVVPGRLLCSGIRLTRVPGIDGDVAVGGLALIEVAGMVATHEIPVSIYPGDDAAVVLSRNATLLRLRGGEPILYAVPEDSAPPGGAIRCHRDDQQPAAPAARSKIYVLRPRHAIRG
jgi:hypothetical protein